MDHSSSRGRTGPVPDPLLLREYGIAGNRTRDLWSCSQELRPLDHSGGLLTSSLIYIHLYNAMWWTGMDLRIRKLTQAFLLSFWRSWKMWCIDGSTACCGSAPIGNPSAGHVPPYPLFFKRHLRHQLNLLLPYRRYGANSCKGQGNSICSFSFGCDVLSRIAILSHVRVMRFPPDPRNEPTSRNTPPL
jgi:hypothetical protein